MPEQADISSVLVPFAIALAVAYASTPWARKVARRVDAIDHPRDRNVHEEPTPRLGGLAIYLAILLSTFVEFLIHRNPIGLRIALIGGILVAVGYWDDTRDMRPVTKLVAQVITAIVLWKAGIRIVGFSDPFGTAYHHLNLPMSLLFTVIWTVGVTNTINLIDGLDGLAAGVSAISSGTLCLMALQKANSLAVAPVAAAICGSAIGFLRYNFNPAKIFMGDTGSQLLGFMLAAISVAGTFKSAATFAIVIPVLVLGVPVFDTTFAILRRFLAGKPIFSADRGHLHHRLLDRGLTQRQVVIILYFITFLLCVAAYALSRIA